MIAARRLSPLFLIGVLFALSACVNTPRVPAATSQDSLRYCNPYGLSTVGSRCYNGLAYGSYYGGGYGYPPSYGPGYPLYGAYGFNRGRAGLGSYYFNDGYHFGGQLRHGHGDFGFVSYSPWRSDSFGHAGLGAGHPGSYGGFFHDGGVRSGVGHHATIAPRHVDSSTHRGSNVGHGRSSHHGSRRH